MMTPGDRACDLQEGLRTFVWRGGEKEKVTLQGKCGHTFSERRPWGDGEIDGRGGWVRKMG